MPMPENPWQGGPPATKSTESFLKSLPKVELRSLKSQLEEAGINSEDKLLIDLDNARSSMMTFMKEFSEEFPFDKYPMDKDAYKDMDNAALSTVNGKLIDQKKSIDLVSELFEISMLNATDAIKNL